MGSVTIALTADNRPLGVATATNLYHMMTA